MKKRWSIVLACLMISICVFSLTACNGGGNDIKTHTHTPCETCGLCTDSNCTGPSSEKCPGHTVTPPVEKPELKGMNTYFSGVKTVTARDTLLDENGLSKSFDELLDRQIDVLAQDLIYRLTYVYGYNETKHNRESNAFLLLKDGDNNYAYNSNNSKVDSNSLVTNNKFESCAHSKNWDISCMICIQKSLIYVVESADNLLLNNSYLYYAGAIEGRYCVYKYGGLYNSSKTDNGWHWTTEITTYENYLTAHKNSFKMAIAQIMAEKPITGEFNLTLYESLLTEINRLGYTVSMKSKIVDFINNTVIGTDLIAKDNKIHDDYFAANPIVDADFAANAPKDGEYCPRFYKGYNIVILAIVEQALSNTFENMDISLYPQVSRNSVSVSSSYTNLSVDGNTQGIVLMPKANTPMTKLAVEVQGQAGQTATLSLKAVIGGTEYPVSQSVTFTGDKQTVEIDLSSAGRTMGAYNGNTQSYTNNHLFGNTDLPDTHGDNYLQLDLSGANGNFTLSFTGLYNK